MSSGDYAPLNSAVNKAVKKLLLVTPHKTPKRQHHSVALSSIGRFEAAKLVFEMMQENASLAIVRRLLHRFIKNCFRLSELREVSGLYVWGKVDHAKSGGSAGVHPAMMKRPAGPSTGADFKLTHYPLLTAGCQEA